MFKLRIKPISVNEMYKGRKFRTKKCHLFKEQMALHLRDLDLPKLLPKEEFFMIYRFYTSSQNDVDNLIKATQDSICTSLGTDDRYISGLFVRKIKVKKGEERIEFDVFKDESKFLKSIKKSR